MHVKMLIDSIMQQTTVLIAQLSTAAGIRAPLAKVADQVFVDLAQELEAQGVGRRVAADMFGLALRSYQKKLRRLTASQSAADRTLWLAMLEHVRQHECVRRAELLQRFARDGEREVGAILSDLVGTGLLYQTGRGPDALYRVTSDVDLRRLTGSADPEALAPVVWSAIHDQPRVTETALGERLGVEPTLLAATLASLIAEGRVERDAPTPDARLTATDLVVPVGATQGWEVAVHDHFRAVANAIATKVRSGTAQSRHDDVAGGATLSFDVSEDHPYRARVHGLLGEVRERVNALWSEVEAYNARHPSTEQARRRVFFYFGQYEEQVDENGGDAERDRDDSDKEEP